MTGRPLSDACAPAVAKEGRSMSLHDLNRSGNRTFVYAQSPNAGLIELDEQPPLALDEDALDITLTVSALLNAKPVSLIQTMRKTVVDGSNTSGFQRTSLIATGGVLTTSEGPVGIDVVCLEEDSARKLDTVDLAHGQQVIYNLDRLGLPLIEIATSPDVRSPDHAKTTAIALGRALRRTRRVAADSEAFVKTSTSPSLLETEWRSRAVRTSTGFRPLFDWRWRDSCISTGWPTTSVPILISCIATSPR